MRTLLIAAAAGLAALAFPAASTAKSSASQGSGSTNTGNFHHDGRSTGFGDHRRHFRSDGPDGAWGYYEGDYDANRSFDEHKWNDWWHDRPDRAFPRWVQTNQNCTPDRMWWSGSGWHC
jgi:hypothetical protein